MEDHVVDQPDLANRGRDGKQGGAVEHTQMPLVLASATTRALTSAVAAAIGLLSD